MYDGRDGLNLTPCVRSCTAQVRGNERIRVARGSGGEWTMESDETPS